MKSVVSFFIIIITISLCGFSQTVRFTYDASGNRTQRYLEVKEVKQTAGDTAEFLLPEFISKDIS